MTEKRKKHFLIFTISWLIITVLMLYYEYTNGLGMKYFGIFVFPALMAAGISLHIYVRESWFRRLDRLREHRKKKIGETAYRGERKLELVIVVIAVIVAGVLFATGD